MRNVGITGVLLLALACGGDSTAPVTGADAPQRILVDAIVTHQFTPDEPSANYTLKAVAPTTVSIFIDTKQSGFRIEVFDSISHAILRDVTLTQGDRGQFGAHSGAFVLAADRIVQFRVTALSGGNPSTTLRVYRIALGPEIAATNLTFGDTVSTETLGTLADIDEFYFSATAGATFALQASDGDAGAGVAVLFTVHSATDTASIATLRTSGQDNELATRSTGLFTAPTAGSWVVSVRQDRLTVASGEAPEPVGYSFQLLRASLNPEHVSATLPADSVSGESLDYIGDVDDFELRVTAGEYYKLFVQALPSFQGILKLERKSTGEATLVNANNGPLGTHALATFRAAFAGVERFRVSGLLDGRGPYRVFAYPINPAPEDAPAVIPLGGTVLETIEFPGDIDVFTLEQGVTGLLAYVIAPEPSGAGAAGLSFSGCTSYVAVDGSCHLMATSSTRLTVSEDEQATIGSAAIGARYSVSTMPIDPAPETNSSVIPLNTLVSESIEPLADVDIFALDVNPERPLTLSVAAPPTGIRLSVRNGGSSIELDRAGVSTSAPFRLVQLDGPPDFRLTITTSAESRRTLASDISYTLQISYAATTTETAPPVIALNTAVVTERIDVVGDIDGFVYQGPPGSQVVATIRDAALTVDAADAETDRVFQRGGQQTSGVVTVPASGGIKFLVWELVGQNAGPFSSGRRYTGPYTLELRAAN